MVGNFCGVQNFIDFVGLLIYEKLLVYNQVIRVGMPQKYKTHKIILASQTMKIKPSKITNCITAVAN